MKYTAKSFTVPASSAKAPAECAHTWVDEKRGRCVLCGEKVSAPKLATALDPSTNRRFVVGIGEVTP